MDKHRFAPLHQDQHRRHGKNNRARSRGVCEDQRMSIRDVFPQFNWMCLVRIPSERRPLAPREQPVRDREAILIDLTVPKGTRPQSKGANIAGGGGPVSSLSGGLGWTD